MADLDQSTGQPVVAVFGDTDINLIDGSSIWLVSLCSVLNRLDIRGHVLLKAPEQRDVLSGELAGLERFRVWPPGDVGVSGRIRPSTLVGAVSHIDNEEPLDVVIVRGSAAASELAASGRFAGRLWPYLTDVPQVPDDMTTERYADLLRIFDASSRILCQTEDLRSFLVSFFPDHDGKMILLPPMVPEAAFDVEHIGGDPGHLRLFYAGKFAPQWGIEEMLAAVAAVRADQPEVTITVAGDKIHDPADDPGYRRRVQDALEADGVHWLGPVERDRIFATLGGVDLALSVRSRELDSSREISTKLLEYAAAGVPVLANRTLAHEELLGVDYPLFVSDPDELAERIADIGGDRAVLEVARSGLAEVAEPYSMGSVAAGLWPALEQSTAWSGHDLTGRRIAVAGHDLRFGEELISGLKRAGAEVRLDIWGGGDKHDEALGAELIQWADTIVCEWCLANAAWYSRHKRPDQRLVVRFHRTELNSEWPPRVDMAAVDTVVFVGDHIRSEAREKFGWAGRSLIVIPNFVDTVAFDRPKLPGAVFTLGLLGFLPRLKRLDRALDVLEALRIKDDRYRLILKGTLPWELPWVWRDDAERSYYEEQFARIRSASVLHNAVTVDRPGGDVPSWFRKVGFVLSPSDIESFHLAMVEGMVSRSVPIAADRAGAASIVGSTWIVDDTDTAVDRIMAATADGLQHLGGEAHAEAVSRYATVRAAAEWLSVVGPSSPDDGRPGATEFRPPTSSPGERP